MRQQLRTVLTGGKLVLAMGIAFLCALTPEAHAEVIELAHTKVADVEGTTEFIEGDKGGYDFLQYTPKKIGDSITFTVRLRVPGHLHFQVTTYKDGAEGVYAMEVEGQELARKDFYLGNVWEVGDFDVQPGSYQVTFRCVDKNPKSGGIGLKFGNLDVH